MTVLGPFLLTVAICGTCVWRIVQLTRGSRPPGPVTLAADAVVVALLMVLLRALATSPVLQLLWLICLALLAVTAGVAVARTGRRPA